MEYLVTEFAGVGARVKSLPLAEKRLRDFVRGRMGASRVHAADGGAV